MDGREKRSVEGKMALFNLAVRYFYSYILFGTYHPPVVTFFLGHTIHLYPLYIILPYK